VLRHVVTIRTNVVVMIASALGYYMFAGLRTFGVEFAEEQYGVAQRWVFVLVAVLGVGAISGGILGGRVADGLIRRRHLDARIIVPAVAFVGVGVFFLPALLTTSVLVAVPFLTVAAAFLAATNPALDSARLDVMPFRLWGRAEAVRTTLRTALEALAPLIFGALSEHVFGGPAHGGLRSTFLVMLAPLFVAPAVLLLARRSYPRDVATASASNELVDDGPADGTAPVREPGER
jgi:MFS family permease